MTKTPLRLPELVIHRRHHAPEAGAYLPMKSFIVYQLSNLKHLEGLFTDCNQMFPNRGPLVSIMKAQLA